MIRVRYKSGPDAEPLILEVAEKPEIADAAEFLEAIRARLYPGVKTKLYVFEEPREPEVTPATRKTSIDVQDPFDANAEDLDPATRGMLL